MNGYRKWSLVALTSWKEETRNYITIKQSATWRNHKIKLKPEYGDAYRTVNLKEILWIRSILNEFTEIWLARFRSWDKKKNAVSLTKHCKKTKRDGELNKTAFSCINSIYSSTKNNKTLRDKFNQRGTENY